MQTSGSRDRVVPEDTAGAGEWCPPLSLIERFLCRGPRPGHSNIFRPVDKEHRSFCLLPVNLLRVVSFSRSPSLLEMITLDTVDLGNSSCQSSTYCLALVQWELRLRDSSDPMLSAMGGGGEG